MLRGVGCSCMVSACTGRRRGICRDVFRRRRLVFVTFRGGGEEHACVRSALSVRGIRRRVAWQHAAHFPIRFLQWLLAAPRRRQNLESAPFYFAAVASLANNKRQIIRSKMMRSNRTMCSWVTTITGLVTITIVNAQVLTNSATMFGLFPVIREKKRLKPQPSIAQALDFRR